jgi:cytochrome c551/c552
MRRLALASAAALLAAASLPALPAAAQAYGPAAGAPAYGRSVNVSIGPMLQDRAARFYGQRELAGLQEDLTQEVSRALARPRGNAPTQVDLMIEDAKPNRPTFDQLGREPGLSLRSVAIGGARVSGWATMADGARVPIRFSWYENDLRNELAASTWSDAGRAFQMLASDLSRGRIPNRYGPGDMSARNGDFGDRFPFSRWPG